MDASTRFRSRQHAAQRADDAVIVRPTRGPVRAVPASLASLLRVLTRFRTIDQHIAALDGRPGPTRKAIQRLHRLGLVETEADARGRWPSRSPDPVEITTIGIPTRNRPETLQRAVTHLGPDGPRLLVIDTSTRPSTVVSRRPVVVVDNAGLERFADQLGARAHHPRAARLALGLPRGGWQAGAARNAMILLGGGSGMVSIDDDLTSRAHTLAEHGPGGFRTVADADPYEVRPARSVDSAIAAHPVTATDLVRCFQGTLGQPAEVLIGASPLDGRPRLGERVASGARAVAARAGVVGDSGLGSPMTWLASRGPALDAIAGDAQRWEEHRTSRAMMRAVSQACLTDTPGFMTPVWGVDLREMVPPFPPWGRAADSVWGAFLHRTRTDSVIAHIPVAFEHRPPGERPWDLTLAARGVAHLRFRDLVVDATLLHPPIATDPAARVVHIGRILGDLARLPTDDLVEWVFGAQLRTLSGRMRRIRAEVPPDLAPGFLTARRQAVLEIQTCLERGQLRLQDLPGLPLLQRRLGELGAVLRAWPDLYDAARGLGESP